MYGSIVKARASCINFKAGVSLGHGFASLLFIYLFNFTNKEGIHKRQSLYRVSAYKNTNINNYKLDSYKTKYKTTKLTHKLINTQIIVKMVPERFPIAIFKNMERYCVPKKCSIHEKRISPRVNGGLWRDK